MNNFFRCGVCRNRHQFPRWEDDPPSRTAAKCFARVFESLKIPEGFEVRGFKAYDPRGVPFYAEEFFYEVLESRAPHKTLQKKLDDWCLGHY